MKAGRVRVRRSITTMRHSGCPHLTLGRARRLLVTRFHVSRDDANMCKRAGFTVNGVERIPSNATSPTTTISPLSHRICGVLGQQILYSPSYTTFEKHVWTRKGWQGESSSIIADVVDLCAERGVCRVWERAARSATVRSFVTTYRVSLSR